MVSPLCLWWSSTTIVLHLSTSSGHSVYPGRFTSTTTSNVLSDTYCIASLFLINKSSSYSGTPVKVSTVGLSDLVTSLSTILACLFRAFDALYIPIAAPNASASLILCPIMMTLSATSISSLSACALTLALTLVFFSTVVLFPPKKVVWSPSLTTVWSPPRPSARSIAARAIS